MKMIIFSFNMSQINK